MPLTFESSATFCMNMLNAVFFSADMEDSTQGCRLEILGGWAPVGMKQPNERFPSQSKKLCTCMLYRWGGGLEQLTMFSTCLRVYIVWRDVFSRSLDEVGIWRKAQRPGLFGRRKVSPFFSLPHVVCRQRPWSS